VAEAIGVLKGEGPLDTTTLTVELGAEMLVLAGVSSTLESARESMNEVLKDGRALAKFADMIEAQGGDPGICDNLQKLPAASGTVHIPAIEDGYVASISPMETAMAALELGAGRRIKEDAVDPATGVSLLVQVGDWVETGEPLAILHHNDRGIEEAVGRMARAFEVSKEPVSKAPLIIERM
jgi:pyrimidine-nucleoside phosphorylase